MPEALLMDQVKRLSEGPGDADHGIRVEEKMIHHGEQGVSGK